MNGGDRVCVPSSPGGERERCEDAHGVTSPPGGEGVAEHCITCGDVALPMRVTALHGDGTATARDASGVTCTISIEMVPEAAVGEELLIHAGFAIAGARG